MDFRVIVVLNVEPFILYVLVNGNDLKKEIGNQDIHSMVQLLSLATHLLDLACCQLEP